MNREIRFKAKDKHGDWQYGHVALVNFYGDFHCWKMFNTDQGKEGIAVDPKTIDQSTGLKDKNGVEIFEGDIVAFSSGGDYIGVIDFDSAMFIVNWKQPCYVRKDLGKLIGINDHMEVIGNIHDNPELLIDKNDEE